MDLKAVKIGVLGGGISAERDISLLSAKSAYEALLRQGVKPVLIDINSSQSQELEKLLRFNLVDCAFIALHGEFGEDGGIQEILENLGIAYTGSDPQASALAMNKILTKEKFKQAGVSTASFKVFSQGNKIPDNLSFPLVVKPYCSGSSLGISIVREQSELEAALELAFKHQSTVLLEDYIDGRELTVGILDEHPLSIVEIIPKKAYYNFDAKYNDALTQFIAPAKIPKTIYRQVQDLALSAHQALGCRHFSRVDLRLNQQGQAYVLEVNSIPGLTSHSLLPLSAKVSGIEFDSLILTMVELGIKKTQAKPQTFSATGLANVRRE